MCGDPAAQAMPHKHEAGGIYANGTITGTYTEGTAIRLNLALATYHKGRISYRICPYPAGDAASERAALTETCLNQYKLLQADVPGAQLPGSPFFYLGNGSDAGWWPPRPFPATFQLPMGLRCDGATTKCVLQMYYVTGNSCNPPGTPTQYALSYLPTCGTPSASYPEEFW